MTGRISDGQLHHVAEIQVVMDRVRLLRRPLLLLRGTELREVTERELADKLISCKKSGLLSPAQWRELDGWSRVYHGSLPYRDVPCDAWDPFADEAKNRLEQDILMLLYGHRSSGLEGRFSKYQRYVNELLLSTFLVEELSLPMSPVRKQLMLAVKRHGHMFKCDCEALHADRETVLQVVHQCGRALEYVSSELQADQEVVLQAVRQGGSAALCCAADHLRGHYILQPKIVQRNPFAVGGDSGVVCNLVQLLLSNDCWCYEANIGLGGCSVKGFVHCGATLGDLGVDVCCRARIRCLMYLIMVGCDSPVSPLVSEVLLCDAIHFSS